MREFEEEDVLTVAQLEVGVRCKWSWSWLKLESRCDVKGKGMCVSIVTVKKIIIEKPGHARGSLCCKEINYATKGSHAIFAHCKSCL